MVNDEQEIDGLVWDCGGSSALDYAIGVFMPSIFQCMFAVNRSGLVWYFPDMSGWASGPIFSGEVRFFPDIDRGTSGGDFENYAEPTTHVFRCFKCHTHYKNYF